MAKDTHNGLRGNETVGFACFLCNGANKCNRTTEINSRRHLNMCEKFELCLRYRLLSVCNMHSIPFSTINIHFKTTIKARMPAAMKLQVVYVCVEWLKHDVAI